MAVTAECEEVVGCGSTTVPTVPDVVQGQLVVG